jgi:transmembrane sensor
MTTDSREQNESRRLRAQAAEWFAQVQNSECPAETKTACEQWRNADSRHALAFEQCRTLWLMTRELKNDPDLQTELTAARVKPAGETAAVFVVAPDSTPINAHKRWYMLGAAATFLIVTMAAFLQFSPAPEFYSTQIAEQRLIQLPDGSSVMLNTDSILTVNFSRAKRALELKKGEAYFTVAKDAARPFEVTAASGLVRAVGTEFNVALINRQLAVDVTEGVIEFKAPAEEDQQPLTTQVKQGEAVRFRKGDERIVIQAANSARISAWKARKIYFSADRLDNAVAEYNRYTQKKIIIINDELKQQKISGVFNVDDIDAFIFSLEQLLDVRVEQHQDNVLVMKK